MREYRPTKRTLAKFGLTLVAWLNLIVGCDWHCPICLKAFSRSRLPCVDHRHSDGLIRGIICSPCNQWLGEIHDNAGLLERAASYLSDPPAVRILGERYIPNSSGAAR